MSLRSTSIQSQRATPRISGTSSRLRESPNVGLRSTNKSFATSLCPALSISRSDSIRASCWVQACQPSPWRLCIPPTRQDAVLLSDLTDGLGIRLRRICCVRLRRAARRSLVNEWTNTVSCSPFVFDVKFRRALSHLSLADAVCVTLLGQATGSSDQLPARTSSWPHRDRK
jgi:hypothetical protein